MLKLAPGPQREEFEQTGGLFLDASIQQNAGCGNMTA